MFLVDRLHVVEHDFRIVLAVGLERYADDLNEPRAVGVFAVAFARGIRHHRQILEQFRAYEVAIGVAVGPNAFDGADARSGHQHFSDSSRRLGIIMREIDFGSIISLSTHGLHCSQHQFGVLQTLLAAARS